MILDEVYGSGIIIGIHKLRSEMVFEVNFTNFGRKVFNPYMRQITKIQNYYSNDSSQLGNDIDKIKNSSKNFPYEKANLLTDNERNFYETIRLIAEKHDFNVLSKVRLADIVNVNENVQSKTAEWWEYFKRISQKHIDFALADKNSLEIKLVIEVDDSSHKRPDRIERDRFVDKVLENAGIPILHIENVIGLEDKITNLLFKK